MKEISNIYPLKKRDKFGCIKYLGSIINSFCCVRAEWVMLVLSRPCENILGRGKCCLMIFFLSLRINYSVPYDDVMISWIKWSYTLNFLENKDCQTWKFIEDEFHFTLNCNVNKNLSNDEIVIHFTDEQNYSIY